jgi:hypothetical protein
MITGGSTFIYSRCMFPTDEPNYILKNKLEINLFS